MMVMGGIGAWVVTNSYTPISPAPVPQTMLLLISGLVGVIGFNRSKEKLIYLKQIESLKGRALKRPCLFYCQIMLEFLACISTEGYIEKALGIIFDLQSPRIKERGQDCKIYEIAVGVPAGKWNDCPRGRS